MNLIDAIDQRRSIRHYQDKPVEKPVIEKLLYAATQAPSAMNSQPWAFAVIQDKNVLKDISDRTKAYMLSTLNERPMLEKYRDAFENPDFNIFYDAQTMIMTCAKPGLSPAPQIDCSLAAQNLMLAAKDAGLGTCWIGFAQIYLNTPEAKQTFGIPSENIVIAPIIVGYPDEEPAKREKNPPEILFWK